MVCANEDEMIERIALITDFGAGGGYTGQIRLLLAEALPAMPVVDLISDLEPFRPELAAYFLPGLLRGMPQDTMYLCVVDPGVGSQREALALEADACWYVGPDNGLLALVGRRARHKTWWCLHGRTEQMSATFHGRDLFRALAEGIAKTGNVPGEACGEEHVEGYDWPEDLPKIVYRDGFGNLCSGLHRSVLGDNPRLRLGGCELKPVRTYSDAEPGEPIWYENSFGLVEVAISGGRADEQLGVGPGDELQVLTDE